MMKGVCLVCFEAEGLKMQLGLVGCYLVQFPFPGDRQKLHAINHELRRT